MLLSLPLHFWVMLLCAVFRLLCGADFSTLLLFGAACFLPPSCGWCCLPLLLLLGGAAFLPPPWNGAAVLCV